MLSILYTIDYICIKYYEVQGNKEAVSLDAVLCQLINHNKYI